MTFTDLPPTVSSTLAVECAEFPNSVPYAYYFTKALELYEVSNHVILTQMPTWSSFGDSLGLPRLFQNAENSSLVLRLDECFSRWERSLPRSLRLDASQSSGDEVLHRQVVMLFLR